MKAKGKLPLHQFSRVSELSFVDEWTATYFLVYFCPSDYTAISMVAGTSSLLLAIESPVIDLLPGL